MAKKGKTIRRVRTDNPTPGMPQSPKERLEQARRFVKSQLVPNPPAEPREPGWAPMGKEKGTKANPFVKKTLSSTLKGRQQMFHAKQEPLFAGGPAGTTKHVPVATPRVHGVHPSQEHLFSTGERLRVSAGNIASGIPGKVSMAGHIFTEAM